MALAIIGGSPDRFAVLANLHRRTLAEHGFDPASAPLAVHAHGYVSDDVEKGAGEYFPSYAIAMSAIGQPAPISGVKTAWSSRASTAACSSTSM